MSNLANLWGGFRIASHPNSTTAWKNAWWTSALPSLVTGCNRVRARPYLSVGFGDKHLAESQECSYIANAHIPGAVVVLCRGLPVCTPSSAHTAHGRAETQRWVSG